MGRKINQLKRRKAARKELADLFERASGVVVVHYSCESFYDRTDGSSPRVTSIAVRNLVNGQTKSFSIHQMAEKTKVLPYKIAEQFRYLEEGMLNEFFEYAKTHQRSQWLHWNMRDINYGFAALEHRFQVLGGTSVEIPEDNRHDLARILISIYGVGYAGHPRLESLMAKNKITTRDFLIGAEEAKAFENGDYVKLHQSTLRKVDVIANIAERAENETLQTNSSWWEIHGGTLGALGEWLKEHWIVSVVSAIGSIGATIYNIYPWLHDLFLV